MDYKEQIQHPNWQKKRLEVLERDSFECQSCGNTEAMLHVHHLTYSKNCLIWDYHNDNLITFCMQCHKEWHQIKEDIIDIISQPDLELIIQIRILLDTVRELGSNNISNVINIIEVINKITK